jgi:hypothetical protein
MSRVDRSKTGSTTPLESESPLCPVEPDATRTAPPDRTPVDGFDVPDATTRFLFGPGGDDAPATDAASDLFPELDNRLAFVRTGTVPPRAPTAAPTAEAPPGAEEIGRNLDGITEDKKTNTVTQHTPWELNQVIPANKQGKASNYRELLAAERKLNTAIGSEGKAQTALARAQEAHAAAPTQRTAAAVAQAEKKLSETAKEREKAQASYDREDGELRMALKGKSNEKPGEVDALSFKPSSVEKTTSRVTVGGVATKFSNAVDSYATARPEGLDGKAEGDSKALVNNAIDATQYSDSTKNVFKGVSSNEGTFSSVNGYDSKGITFGFIQMAGGGAGETFSDFLGTLKKQHPDTFAATLQKYGIDVEKTRDGKNELVLHQPDGTTLRGKEAAIKIGSDPKLAGALAAAGTNADVQDSQLRFAKAYWDKQRGSDIHAGGQAVKVSDLITSEYGNGILFDRSVHGGIGGAHHTLEKVVEKYLEDHPGAQLSDEDVRGKIEAAYINEISSDKDLAGRCANIANETSTARGSYVE